MAINKIIYGADTLLDLTGDTVDAAHLATGYTAHDRSGASITGTMAGGSWTLLAQETTSSLSTTTTSATYWHGLSVPVSSGWTSDKILYVKVRDTQGKRNGYFYGTDNFLINQNPINGSTVANTGFARFIWSVTTAGKYAVSVVAATGGLGVYAYNYNYTDQEINIYYRYNNSTTKTINSTFKIEVFLLTPYNNISPLT